MKSQTLVAVLVAVAIVGGCQAVKESGDGIGKSFRQSGKQFVQQKLDEWIALAGVEVQWNHVPEEFQRQGMARFVLGKDKSRSASFNEGCEPSPKMVYPRSRESIDSQKELFEFARSIGWWIAACDDGDHERYQLEHEANKWRLARWREAGLRLNEWMRSGVFCTLDREVRKYKQRNPGRPVDADVLDFMKVNYLPDDWVCNP